MLGALVTIGRGAPAWRPGWPRIGQQPPGPAPSDAGSSTSSGDVVGQGQRAAPQPVEQPGHGWPATAGPSGSSAVRTSGRPVDRKQRLVAAAGIDARRRRRRPPRRRRRAGGARRRPRRAGHRRARRPSRPRSGEGRQARGEARQRPAAGRLLAGPRHGTLKWTLRSDDDNRDGSCPDRPRGGRARIVRRRGPAPSCRRHPCGVKCRRRERRRRTTRARTPREYHSRRPSRSAEPPVQASRRAAVAPHE